MGLLSEENRRVRATSLKAFRTQAINAVAQLKAIKTNLTNLKTALGEDGDFTIADQNDCDTILAEIDTAVGEI